MRRPPCELWNRNDLHMRTSAAKVRRTFSTVVCGLTVATTATTGSLTMHAAKIVALANVWTHVGIDL